MKLELRVEQGTAPGLIEQLVTGIRTLTPVVELVKVTEYVPKSADTLITAYYALTEMTESLAAMLLAKKSK